ncbi:MAG: endonuclease/exonuclease/phosphatase family protein [Caldilineae bacterium]|nr:endonuclease/exonuclease/phosphatase family protein [Caldilineae bacterium]
MLFRVYDGLDAVEPPAVSPRLRGPLRLALAAGLGLTLAGRLGGLAWWLELWSHFPLQLGLGLGCCALLAAGLRSPRLALLALLGAAANLVQLAPLYLPPAAVAAAPAELAAGGTAGRSPEVEAPGAPRLDLVAFNTLTRNPRKAEVGAYLAAQAPDLVALVEVDTRWLEALRQALPGYTIVEAAPQPDNFGMLLALRSDRAGLEVEASRVIRAITPAERSFPSIEARLRLEGRPLDLLVLHTMPPKGAGEAALRDRQLAAAASWAAARSAPALVLGDLNITRFSPRFAELLRVGGLQDSALGRGYQASWPYPALPVLGIPIDQALYGRGIRVLDRRVGPGLGSDHRPTELAIALDG